MGFYGVDKKRWNTNKKRRWQNRTEGKKCALLPIVHLLCTIPTQSWCVTGVYFCYNLLFKVGGKRVNVDVIEVWGGGGDDGSETAAKMILPTIIPLY